MRSDRYPAAWGVVTVAEYRRDVDGLVDFTDWRSLVLRPPGDAKIHHGSRGSIAPDVVVIERDGQAIARCDCAHVNLPNYLAYDQEYYFFLRLTEVLDVEAFAQTVWAGAPIGAVLVAWDKFHGLEYIRGEVDQGDTLSFGGSFDDLQGEVAERFPLADGPAPPATPMALLRAIEKDDAAQVRALLAVIGLPDALPQIAEGVPTMAFSHAKHPDLLWSAIREASPAVLELLLDAGADPNRQPEGSMAPIHGAILNDRPAHLALLLERGASLSASWKGQRATEMAEKQGGEIAEVVRAFQRR
ncbi:MAG: ankyrin repeat domain-containing protein [Nannocystaceae bacterium]|nr:ankyrin repeat domain-containing protein [Myxococcales bacterium]